MTERINVWKVNCLEEDATIVFPRFVAEGTPTLCPNDHANRSNIADVRWVGYSDPQETTVTERELGSLEIEMREFALPAASRGTVQQFVLQYDWIIEVSKVCIDINADNLGDRVSLVIAPGLELGELSAELTSGSVLPVEQAVVASPYIARGAVLVLDDAVNDVQEEVGKLKAIDQTNFQLTVQNAVSQTFPAGTKVRMYNYIFRNYPLVREGHREFGAKGFSTKQVPEMVPMLVEVANGDGVAKTLYVTIEYHRQ